MEITELEHNNTYKYLKKKKEQLFSEILPPKLIEN